MATCHHHPDREAEAACSVCGNDLCEECVAPGEAEPTCFDCSISTAGQDLAKKHAADKLDAIPRPPRPRRSRLVQALVGIGIIVIAVELAIIYFMRPQAQGPVTQAPADARKTAAAETGADIILIREGLEGHRREHGELPEDLWDIAEHLPDEIVDLFSDPSTRYEPKPDDSYSLTLQGQGPHPVTTSSDVATPQLEGIER